jgi:hypothetical protein
MHKVCLLLPLVKLKLVRLIVDGICTVRFAGVVPIAAVVARRRWAMEHLRRASRACDL